MVKVIVCILLVLVSENTYSQNVNLGKPITKQDYLVKSKTEKTVAFVLLGIGAGMLVIASTGDVSFDVLPILVIGGGVSVLASIPLFIASKKSKKKSMNAEAYFEIRRNIVTTQETAVAHYAPAISMKINF